MCHTELALNRKAMWYFTCSLKSMRPTTVDRIHRVDHYKSVKSYSYCNWMNEWNLLSIDPVTELLLVKVFFFYTLTFTVHFILFYFILFLQTYWWGQFNGCLHECLLFAPSEHIKLFKSFFKHAFTVTCGWWYCTRVAGGTVAP